jgi:lantibiotic modifying enzyme
MNPIDFDTYYIAAIHRRGLLAIQRRIVDAADAALLPQPLATSLADAAVRYLTERVCWFFQKVFVAELHRYAAETGGDGHDDSNEAGREQAVFSAYVNALDDGPFAQGLRERHAFLYERVDRTCAAFVRYFTAHAGHLRDDFDALTALGIAVDAPPIVRFGRGDPHRGAQTTVHYRFGERDVYYKPRSLGLDVLLARAQALTCPEMPRLVSLDRGSYGWQLGIAGRPKGTDAATRFYRGLGAMNALIHALYGSDIHFENIVTDDDGHPYFIDVEALFTNNTRRDRDSPRPSPAFGAERALDRAIGDSLLSVGIVSLRRTREGHFSGAAQANEVAAPVSREVAVDAKSSKMRLARVQTPVEIVSPVPSIDGRPAAFAAYFADFANGYRDTAIAIARHADALRSMIEQSAHLRSRQVLRHTYLYGLFQAETTHPALTSRESTLRLLGKMRGEEKVKPYLAKVFASEVEQMLLFDAPYFDAGIDDTALGTGDGGEIGEFFETPALRLSLARIARMSDSAWVARQIGFAATVYGVSACDCGADTSHRPLARLRAETVYGEDDGTVLWTFSPPMDTPGNEYAISAMGPDLYTGLGGVIAALARAADSDRDLLRRAVDTALRTLRERGEELPNGPYSGTEGLLLALCDAAETLGDDAMIDDAVDAFLAREARWETDRHDVMDGTAGHALIAIALHRRRADPRLRALAQRQGERLLAAAQAGTHGLQWPLHTMSKAITGFAHGGSGIAYALYEIGLLGEDPRLHEAARSALAQEDAEYHPQWRLWRDTRMDEANYTLSWCNGAAGFLLARAACWPLLDEASRERTRAAFGRSCEWFERTPDDSLCHGTAGIALALAETAPRIDASLPDTVRAPDAAHARFRSGWHHDPDNLGMMVGALGLEPIWASDDPRRLHPLLLLRPSRWA